MVKIKTAEAGRGHIMKDFVNHIEELGFFYIHCKTIERFQVGMWYAQFKTTILPKMETKSVYDALAIIPLWES